MAKLNIPITKGGASIEVDTDSMPESMYIMAMQEGLKVMLNKRMSKVTVAKLEGEKLAEAREAAMVIARKNYEEVMAGTMKGGRVAGAAKISGVVMTEARRLAKEVVKNEIRAAGLKVSHVEASAITKLANELIASDPSYVAQATENIEKRKAKVNEDQSAALAFLQKLGGVAESPKLVAKAEKEKAEKKSTLSAKQAGKVAPRKAKADASATA